jgi:hypothetical protein
MDNQKKKLDLRTLNNYLFYYLYRFWEFVSTPKFWSDGKAVITIGVLEMFFIMTLICGYSVATKNKIEVSRTMVILISIGIFILNYYSFLKAQKWRNVIKRCENDAKAIQDFWKVMVLMVIFVVVVSFCIVGSICRNMK